jgi:hypothetical protein
MGSERFVGQNSAHDPSQSAKATMGGFEGIHSNMNLMDLYSCVELAAKNRKKKDAKPVCARACLRVYSLCVICDQAL